MWYNGHVNVDALYQWHAIVAVVIHVAIYMVVNHDTGRKLVRIR